MNDSDSNPIISLPPEEKPPLQAEAAQKDNTNSQILKRPIILGDLTLASPTTFTTIGTNGAATALTANPVGYITVMVGNTAFQIPYYNMA